MSLIGPSVIVSVLLTCGSQGAPLVHHSESQGIRIEVANSANHRSVSGARVFVLSEEGKELASASTDDHGIAHLPDLGEADRAKYVVVEHPAFFLSGMRWQAGLREYYILATVLTVR